MENWENAKTGRMQKLGEWKKFRKKSFFINLYKMSFTTTQKFKSSQISLGEEEQKRFKYNSIPIFYDEAPFQLLMKGGLKIFKHDKNYSIGLE